MAGVGRLVQVRGLVGLGEPVRARFRGRGVRRFFDSRDERHRFPFADEQTEHFRRAFVDDLDLSPRRRLPGGADQPVASRKVEQRLPGFLDARDQRSFDSGVDDHFETPLSRTELPAWAEAFPLTPPCSRPEIEKVDPTSAGWETPSGRLPTQLKSPLRVIRWFRYVLRIPFPWS